MATTSRIQVFDTTLRDGEQAPGFSMTAAEKLRLAQQLDRLGVDIIEAGFPISSDGDFEAVRAIAGAVRRPIIAGLALFISLFIMGPTVSAMNEQGVQPYLKGDKTQSQAFNDGVKPLQDFMWKTTRDDEVALMLKLAGEERPASRDDVELTTLIPAFILSELRAAFIIGFVIFIPFLIIDMVVSASLMSLGMMMLPPTTIALPFKLLLFVLVNGWGLIITALVGSY